MRVGGGVLTLVVSILTASRLALGLSFLVLASVGLAQSKGQLTVGGKSVPLTNVNAYFTKKFFDETKNDTVVVLADHPLTDAQARDRSTLTRQSRAQVCIEGNGCEDYL